VLAFRGGERILKGNPDVDDVITIPERPSAGDTLALARRLWRRYDLVVSTQPGDRPTGYALLAGRHRVGPVPRAGETGAWWKRHVYHVSIPHEPDAHHVTRMLMLATALGLPHVSDIVCPDGSPDAANEVAPRAAYAVVHATPFYRYKRWTDAGWRDLARGLTERGLAVVVTEGRDPAESAYMEALWADTEVIRERGRLDWAGLTQLLKSAAVYVGPDTSVTHLAAGSGCSTVALYGPTSPRLHGPWPVGGLAEPWNPAGTVQHRGNVWVVQNPLPCLPCEKLGCEGHLDSYSRCLDELSADTVLRVVDQALAR
jgi:heptosyltransferase III